MNDKNLELSNLRGRYVFLEFWGSWCGPCRTESPNITNLATSVSPDSLFVIGFARDSEEDARKYVIDQKIPYPNVIVTEKVLTDYGITGFPSTYLIDPNGIIIAKDMRGKSLLGDVREKMKVREFK